MAGVRDNTVTNVVSGGIASFKSVGQVPLKSLKVNFNPIQEGDGDPSPSNIRPISGWTGLRAGINNGNFLNLLAPQAQASPIASGNTEKRTFVPGSCIIGMSNGNYYRANYANYLSNISITKDSLSWTSGGANGYGIAYVLEGIKSGDTVILNYESRQNCQAFLTYYDEQGGLISWIHLILNNSTGDPTPRTIPDNVKTTLLVFVATEPNSSVSIVKPQLFYGSTIPSTAYEPYNGTTVPVSWSDLGTVYGGYVDLIKGKLVSKYGVADIDSFDYSLNTVLVGVDRYVAQKPSNCKNISNSQSCPNQVSDIYGVEAIYEANDNYSTWITTVFNGQILFYVPANTYSSIEDFKTAMSGHKIYYELATPIEYDIDPIIIKSLIGQNNIWSNANTIEAQYCALESLDIYKQRFKTNEPHLQSVSGDIVNFNTDMVAPLKECKVYFQPVQASGTPSPDNVLPISGWNNINIWLSNKNLLKLDRPEGEPDDTYSSSETKRKFNANTVIKGLASTNDYIPGRIQTFSISNGTLSFTSKSNQNYGIGYPIALKQGTYYLTSNSNNLRRICVLNYKKDGTYFERVLDASSNLNSVTFTIGNSETYMSCIVFLGYVDTQATVSNVMLTRVNSQVYEPFNGSTVSATWYLGDQMYSAEGTVDFIKKRLIANKIMFPLYYYSGWRKSSSGFFTESASKDLIKAPTSSSELPNIMCSHYLTTSINEASNNCITMTTLGWIRVYDNAHETLESFLDYIQRENVYIVVEPKDIYDTPITTDEQLIKSLHSTNNIWSNTNGITQVKYWTHIPKGGTLPWNPIEKFSKAGLIQVSASGHTLYENAAVTPNSTLFKFLSMGAQSGGNYYPAIGVSGREEFFDIFPYPIPKGVKTITINCGSNFAPIIVYYDKNTKANVNSARDCAKVLDGETPAGNTDWSISAWVYGDKTFTIPTGLGINSFTLGFNCKTSDIYNNFDINNSGISISFGYN